MVAYELLQRFLFAVLFEFGEVLALESSTARRLLLVAALVASKIYDADSPKGFWSRSVPIF